MGLPSKQLDALCNPSKDWESTSSDVFVTSTLSLFKAVEMNCLPLEQSFQYLWVTKLFKRHMVLKKRLVHEFFVVVDVLGSLLMVGSLMELDNDGADYVVDESKPFEYIMVNHLDEFWVYNYNTSIHAARSSERRVFSLTYSCSLLDMCCQLYIHTLPSETLRTLMKELQVKGRSKYTTIAAMVGAIMEHLGCPQDAIQRMLALVKTRERMSTVYIMK